MFEKSRQTSDMRECIINYAVKLNLLQNFLKTFTTRTTLLSLYKWKY